MQNKEGAGQVLTRAHAIDPNSFLSVLVCHVLRHGGDCALGGWVQEVLHASIESSNRRYVHNAALDLVAVLQHRRDGVLGHDDHAGDIDRHVPLPVFEVEGHRSSLGSANADIVDKDVQAAKGVDGCMNNAARIFLRRDVAGACNGSPLGICLDVLDRFLRPFQLPVNANDNRAIFCEQVCGSTAVPETFASTARAGNDGNLAFERTIGSEIHDER